MEGDERNDKPNRKLAANAGKKNYNLITPFPSLTLHLDSSLLFLTRLHPPHQLRLRSMTTFIGGEKIFRRKDEVQLWIGMPSKANIVGGVVGSVVEKTARNAHV